MQDAPTRPRVLLADDEVLIRELVQTALEDAGYEVACASSGIEALAALGPDKGFVGLVTDINFAGRRSAGPSPRGPAKSIRSSPSST